MSEFHESRYERRFQLAVGALYSCPGKQMSMEEFASGRGASAGYLGDLENEGSRMELLIR